jgi:hypothetical protein
MKREDVLQEMRASIGTQDPVVFFDKMIDVFSLLFDKLEALEEEVAQTKVQTALAIEWEPRIAADMLVSQIETLRQDKDTYFAEITALKKAYAEDLVTQSYSTFCNFWTETLGWHPFLSYNDD